MNRSWARTSQLSFAKFIGCEDPLFVVRIFHLSRTDRVKTCVHQLIEWMAREFAHVAVILLGNHGRRTCSSAVYSALETCRNPIKAFMTLFYRERCWWLSHRRATKGWNISPWLVWTRWTLFLCWPGRAASPAEPGGNSSSASSDTGWWWTEERKWWSLNKYI